MVSLLATFLIPSKKAGIRILNLVSAPDNEISFFVFCREIWSDFKFSFRKKRKLLLNWQGKTIQFAPRGSPIAVSQFSLQFCWQADIPMAVQKAQTMSCTKQNTLKRQQRDLILQRNFWNNWRHKKFFGVSPRIFCDFGRARCVLSNCSQQPAECQQKGCYSSWGDTIPHRYHINLLASLK